MRHLRTIRSSALAAQFALVVAIISLASCGGDGGSAGPTTPVTPVDTTTKPPVTPPTPAPLIMTITTLKTQSLAAGDLPTSAFGVKLTDSTGTPVANVAMTWTVTSGGGSLVNSSAVTDANGLALALWKLGPSTVTQQLTVSSTRVTTPAVFTGTVPIGTVTFTPPSTKQYVGDAFTLGMTVRDTKGTLLTGGLSLVLRDTTIATQNATGAIVGTGDGTTYAVAVTGLLNTPKDSVKLDIYRTLHGTVWTWDDSALPVLRAYSTNGAVTDSTAVAANGTFLLKLTTHTSGFATEVLIDAVNTGSRTFFPALMPISTDCSAHAVSNCIGSDITADVTFILVPTHYTVTRGLYAGQTLAVDLNAAMVTSLHTGPAYLDVSAQFQAPLNHSGSAPALQNLYAANEFAWLPDSFPIGVAIHRACCSTRAVVADDSVQVMRALTRIQSTLGFTIWHPVNDNASFNYDRLTTATPNKTLIFQFDSTLRGAVVGGGSTGPIAAAIKSPQVLMLQDFVVTGWRGSATDHITIDDEMSQSQAIAYNPSVAGSMQQNVLVHEAMHTLGVGHGCSWVSTQSYCGMDPADTLPSFQDAAYLLLAMDVKAAVWKHRALHSLTAGLFGQRAIMMHVDPIPAPWTIPDPGTIPTSNDRLPSSSRHLNLVKH